MEEGRKKVENRKKVGDEKEQKEEIQGERKGETPKLIFYC